MRDISICLYRKLTQVDGSRHTLNWPALCAALSTPHVYAAKADAHGWSAGLPVDDVRGEPCESVSLLVYDVDGPLPDELGLPVEAFAHTTWSHTDESPRWRLVVLTDRAHTPSEHRALWEGASRALGLGEPLDESAKDAVRFFYAPSHKPGAPFHTKHFKGEPLRVAQYLQASLVQPAALTTIDAPAPSGPPLQGPIDLDSYRERVKTMRHGAVRQKLQALLNSGEMPAAGGRNSWMHSAFSAVGAMAWPEEVAELLASEFAARLPLQQGETRAEWKELALGSYRRALESRRHRDALTSVFHVALQAAPKEDWRHHLVTRTNKDGVKSVDSSGYNVALILENDPAFASLRWNVMRFEVEAPEGPLSGVPHGSLDVALQDWLYNSAEYRIRVSREDASARLMLVARNRPYDPVKEYLLGLKWDGQKRIDTVLARLCGVINNEYTRGVSRRFFVGAVARAMEPGCQLDTVLLLHGPQGLGKTSFVRAVGGPFMAELHMDPSAKDTLQTIAGRWFIELSELASARRTDVETMRAFITRRTDVLRLPYGRIVEEFPRRCVFVGTTNDDTPLRDTHGSRRYWPVTVGRVDVASIERERDQLFAEALEAYRSGERWWFTDADQDMANREAELFVEADLWQEYIREWWERLDTKPETITLMEIARRALLLDPNNFSTGTAQRIGRALRHLGFKKLGRGRGVKSSEYAAPTAESILEKIR